MGSESSRVCPRLLVPRTVVEHPPQTRKRKGEDGAENPTSGDGGEGDGQSDEGILDRKKKHKHSVEERMGASVADGTDGREPSSTEQVTIDHDSRPVLGMTHPLAWLTSSGA